MKRNVNELKRKKSPDAINSKLNGLNPKNKVESNLDAEELEKCPRKQ